MDRGEKPLDAEMDVVTPENISFRYQVAGPFRRLPAFLIDLAIRFGVMLALVLVLSFLGFVLQGMAELILLISWFLMEWFYGGLFEGLWGGQTPGKRLMGLRVLTADGHPVTLLQAVIRNLLRIVDFFPMFPLNALFMNQSPFPVPLFLVGLVSCALNDRYQRLGDLVCNTIVVIEDRGGLLATARLEDPRAAQLAQFIPPTFVVNSTLAQSLAIYVERRPYFSLPRRKEIARHIAEPLLARFGFPPDTSYDLLLCALYYNTFIAEKTGEVGGDHRPLGMPEQAGGPSPTPGITFLS